MTIHPEYRAITRFMGASDTQGARILVRYGGKSKTYPYPHEARNAHDYCVGQFVRSFHPDAWIMWANETRTGKGNVYTVTPDPKEGE